MDDEFEGMVSDAEKEVAETKEPEAEKQKEPEQPKPEDKEQDDKPSDSDEPKEEKPEEAKEEKKEVIEEKDNPFGKSGHTPKGLQDRINSLTREKHEQRREIESLRKELEELKNSTKAPSVEPSKEDFLKAGKTEADYINYLVDKKAESKVSEILDRRGQEEALARRNAELKSREDYARGIFPDYDSVMYGEGTIKASDEAISIFTDDPMGVQALYTIRKVPGLLDAFNKCTTSDGEVKFIEGVIGQLAKLKEQATNPPAAATNQPAATQAQTQQQPQTKLREPAENKTATSRKAPDWSKASLEEIEAYYG